MKHIIKKILHILLELIIIAGVIMGVLLESGVFINTLWAGAFKSFTTLSNIFALSYHAPYLVRIIKEKEDAKPFCPIWRMAVMVSVFQTCMVAMLFLGGGFGHTWYMVYSMILLHLVVPISVWTEYFFFAEKGGFKYPHLAAAPVPSIIYGITAYAAPYFGFHLGNGKSVYPYWFMDVNALGVPAIVIISVAAVLELAFVGALLVFIDKLFAGRRDRKKRKEEKLLRDSKF